MVSRHRLPRTKYPTRPRSSPNPDSSPNERKLGRKHSEKQYSQSHEDSLPVSHQTLPPQRRYLVGWIFRIHGGSERTDHTKIHPHARKGRQRTSEACIVKKPRP